MNTLKPVLDFYLSRQGEWCQGSYGQPPKYCLLAATRAVSDATGVPHVDFIREIIRRTAGEEVCAWNDDPDRTFGDVVEMLSEDDPLTGQEIFRAYLITATVLAVLGLAMVGVFGGLLWILSLIDSY